MSEIITSLQTELSNRHANMVSEAVLAFSEHHDSALHSYFLNARVKYVHKFLQLIDPTIQRRDFRKPKNDRGEASCFR